MNRKILFTVLTLMMITAITAGCASIQLPWSKTGSQSSQNTAGAAPQTVEDKLALGILKMEDTPNAVTAEQAKKLLPLWKAVQGLSRDSKTTPEEMNGLYHQIKDSLTPEQSKAIEGMTIEQGELQQIMQKYGVQMRAGAPGQGQGTARTPSANGSSQRSFQGGPGGGFQGGPGGGFPPGSFEGGQRSGNRSNSGSSTQSTPQAGAARQGFRGGMNFILSGAVIKLLEQRAGS